MKKNFLYQQHQLALRKTESLLQALPVLRKLLDETEATNQLVACRTYLANDTFSTELGVLTFFNHHVTFIFLNCTERSNQADLVKMLPKYYDELVSGQTDTLNEGLLHIHHINVVAPTIDLQRP